VPSYRRRRAVRARSSNVGEVDPTRGFDSPLRGGASVKPSLRTRASNRAIVVTSRDDPPPSLCPQCSISEGHGSKNNKSTSIISGQRNTPKIHERPMDGESSVDHIGVE